MKSRAILFYAAVALQSDGHDKRYIGVTIHCLTAASAFRLLNMTHYMLGMLILRRTIR